MNTNKLQSILDAYNPEDDLGKITYTDAALLEVVIDMAEQIDELRQQVARLESQIENAIDYAPSLYPLLDDERARAIVAQQVAAAKEGRP